MPWLGADVLSMSWSCPPAGMCWTICRWPHSSYRCSRASILCGPLFAACIRKLCSSYLSGLLCLPANKYVQPKAATQREERCRLEQMLVSLWGLCSMQSEYELAAGSMQKNSLGLRRGCELCPILRPVGLSSSLTRRVSSAEVCQLSGNSGYFSP